MCPPTPPGSSKGPAPIPNGDQAEGRASVIAPRLWCDAVSAALPHRHGTAMNTKKPARRLEGRIRPRVSPKDQPCPTTPGMGPRMCPKTGVLQGESTGKLKGIIKGEAQRKT